MSEISPAAMTAPAATDDGATERDLPCISLCVPTFRRPAGLRKLLTHVARLTYRGSLSVVVVDNDAEALAGLAVVQELAPSFPFPLSCTVEPRRGHTFAYNRAFALACRSSPAPRYVAVLDDDEYPDPNWLTEMVSVASRYGVDLVGGPVLPVFDEPDHWLAKSGLYAPVRYATGRVVMIWGAGNMLIRRSVLEHYLDEPFLHAFALTGGSDVEFFWRCRRDGRTFAWADSAQVFETTPRSRTGIGWLLRRRFGNGAEATRIERMYVRRRGSGLRRWAKGIGLLGLGIAALPVAAFAGRRAVMCSLVRAARGTGRIAAEFKIYYEEYAYSR